MSFTSVLGAVKTVLVIILIGAFVSIAYKAFKHPAEFAQDTAKAAGSVLIQYQTTITDLVNRGFDDTLGRVPPPAVGKALSGIGKASVNLPGMAVTKPVEVFGNLLRGDTSGALDAVKNTPMDAYHMIANIF